MKLVRMFFWESIQNLPLVAGFLLSLKMWQQGKQGTAVGCAVAGSIIGSAVIWATESRIVKEHRETMRAMVANILAIFLLMLLLTVYMSLQWGNLWSDLLVGLVGGIGLGVVQSLAVKSLVSVGHCTAFALSFALGLAGVRLLAAVFPVGVNILLITVVVSAVITVIDYGPSK